MSIWFIMSVLNMGQWWRLAGECIKRPTHCLLIPFFYIGKLLFAYSISAWTKFISRLWQEGTEANTFGSVINLSTGKPRNYAFVETTFEYICTVRKTGTFISIDKDGVNIQEIYCISLDLYIRIFHSPNLPSNFKNYLYL